MISAGGMVCDLQSGFFAQIVVCDLTIPGLEDNTIYIKCVDETWDKAVEALKESYDKSKFRDCWHHKFGYMRITLDVMECPVSIAAKIDDGYNVVTPLYTPDRQDKLYIVGKVDDPSHLELCAALMMVDAQKIEDSSSMQAFVDTFNKDPEKAFAEWNQLLDYKSARPFSSASISFKGKYSSKQSKYPFLKHDYNLSKMELGSYEDQLSKIMGISDIVKKLDMPTDNQELEVAEKDFQCVCEVLKDSEKNELLLELSKVIPDEQLKGIWQAVTNRQYKGQKSTVRIEVRPKLKVYDGNRTDRLEGDYRTYMVDSKGAYHLLNFANNTAHTVYIMNLLYHKQNPGQLQSLDIRKNKAAFIKIYNVIYLGNKDGRDAFEQLMCRLSNTVIDYDGKAKSRCFNSIVNCVTEMCRKLNIDPSPYIADAERPLTFNPQLIDIAPELMRDFKSITFNM